MEIKQQNKKMFPSPFILQSWKTFKIQGQVSPDNWMDSLRKWQSLSTRTTILRKSAELLQILPSMPAFKKNAKMIHLRAYHQQIFPQILQLRTQLLIKLNRQLWLWVRDLQKRRMRRGRTTGIQNKEAPHLIHRFKN